MTMDASFDDWLRSLTDESRQDAELLRARHREVGNPEPDDWVQSEVSESIPQLTRYLVLRKLWDEINGWEQPDAIMSIPAAKRLIDAGANRDDVVLLARAAAYEAVFATIHTIDEAHDPDAPGDFPGWILMETTDADGLTGRDVAGLHEDLLSLDPSGRDGADLSQ